jgi:cyclopropane-fatty-acyl-phospholipid synthase
MDPYSAAMAFVSGRIDIHGDIFAAIRYFFRHHHSVVRQVLFSGLASLQHLKTSFLLGRRSQAARTIRFHYDCSNEFYSQFLDSRMIYSAAHFCTPNDSLETAQRRKLEAICRDLSLRAGDRFLDIGCGWGGLVTYAAKHFGVQAFGCTVAQRQFDFAQHVVEREVLQKRVFVSLCDYRDIGGPFDKIASVGMFEHVGRSRLAGYFAKTFQLLTPGGFFLNRGVVRPPGIGDGPETLFIQNNVFPGGELVHLDDVVREGERAGFDVVGVRDLREQYALTCRAWVKNLQRNSVTCGDLVGDCTYRTWLLYLAASAVGFEDKRIGAAQVLFYKASAS